MWSSDRRSLLRALALAPLVAACGFRPALGPGGAAAGLAGRIRADDPPTTDAYHLVERLEERLGRPVTADLRLAYQITTQTGRFARTEALRDSRAQVSGEARWQLLPATGDTPLATGAATSFAAWSLTSTGPATRAAEEDARRRLMRMLADRIVTQLMAEAARLPA